MELKVNLLAPAAGEYLQAHGEVVRPGRSLTVCRGDDHVAAGGERKHVATILATMSGIVEGGT